MSITIDSRAPKKMIINRTGSAPPTHLPPPSGEAFSSILSEEIFIQMSLYKTFPMCEDLRRMKETAFRKPTLTELSVLGAWGLLSLATLIMAFSTRPWLAFLWWILGNRNWPGSTDLYLCSYMWFWVIPLLAACFIYALWKKPHFEKLTPILLLVLHALTLAVFIFSAFAAMLPFLYSTWGITPH